MNDVANDVRSWTGWYERLLDGPRYASHIEVGFGSPPHVRGWSFHLGIGGQVAVSAPHVREWSGLRGSPVNHRHVGFRRLAGPARPFPS